jgi:hypothetical protein
MTIERCKAIVKKFNRRCLNSTRIEGLCLIHYNSKIHKLRYLKRLKVEKYYSGKFNGFWEISEKILNLQEKRRKKQNGNN